MNDPAGWKRVARQCEERQDFARALELIDVLISRGTESVRAAANAAKEPVNGALNAQAAPINKIFAKNMLANLLAKLEEAYPE